MSTLPIRWRLTVWYATTFVLVLCALGGVLWFGLRYQLEDGFAERMGRQIALAGSAVDPSPGTTRFLPSAPVSLDDEEQFVLLFDETGTLVADRSSSYDVPALDRDVAQVLAEGPVNRRRVIGGERVEIALRPFATGTETRGVIAVGVSRDDIEETLHSLVIAFALALPIALSLAGAGGFVIAGRALAPVAQMTTLAASVDATDLSSRIELSLPNDEIGQLASTFNTMLDRVAAAFERQRRFTGDASHELRTPLAAMRAEIDLTLSRPRVEAEYVAALERLDHDARGLTDLLETLLALARADDGKLLEGRQSVELRAIIENVIDECTVTANVAGIDIALRLEPVTISGNPVLLTQLVSNLIGNAIAHTPSGGRISVTLETTLGEHARISVEDTGSGIPAEHVDAIFDRFYRIDDARTRAAGGVGLGLSLCRAIADAHGGSIVATSSQGRGARFEVLLPIA